MRDMKDIAWLAGLLEGEGCFRTHKNCPGLTVNMTDEDVIARAAKVLGYPKPTVPYIQRPGRKPIWCLSLHGKHAIAWMMTLYTFMGTRRRAKIREIIVAWTAHKGRKYTTRGLRVMAQCHPGKREHAKGLCRNCYQKRNVDIYKQKPEWAEHQRKRKREWEAKKKGIA
jgi:hypothetical protein